MYPAWFIEKVILPGIYGTSGRVIGGDDIKRIVHYLPIFPLYPDIELDPMQ